MAAAVPPLPIVYVLNAVSWSPVSPVSLVFKKNVHSAVLLWPVNFLKSISMVRRVSRGRHE